MKRLDRSGALLIAAAAFGASGFAMAPSMMKDRTVPQSSEIPKAVSDPVTPLLALEDTWHAAPFRADRKLPGGRYAPPLPTSEGVAAPERPGWLLRGVIGGTVPLAVFEVGSAEVTLIGTVGDELSGNTVAAIRADTVILRSGSTDWRFTVEAPWR